VVVVVVAARGHLKTFDPCNTTLKDSLSIFFVSRRTSWLHIHFFKKPTYMCLLFVCDTKTTRIKDGPIFFSTMRITSIIRTWIYREFIDRHTTFPYMHYSVIPSPFKAEETFPRFFIERKRERIHTRAT